MKSGMQRFYPFLMLVLLSPILLFSQQDSVEYWRQKGIDRYNNNEFQDAINAFDLAKTFDGADSFKDIESWIQQSYAAFVVQLQNAEERASKAAKAGELAGLAYDKAINNPTHGLRVAEAAVQLNINSKAAKRQMHDIICDTPSPFYSKKLEHLHDILSVAISPEGDKLYTGGRDGTLKIWNTDGEQIDSLKGHQEGISLLKCSANGQYLLSGSYDNTLVLRNNEGRKIREFNNFHADLSCAAFSENGEKILLGGWDTLIQVVSINGQEEAFFKAHDDYISDITIAPDGQTFATASWDKTIKIWNWEMQNLATLKDSELTVSAIDYSPDGKYLISGSWDNKLRLYDLNSNQLIQTFEGHTNSVVEVKFYNNGKIISASEDENLILWSLDGTIIQSYKGHSQPISDFALCEKDAGIMLSAAMDNTALLWNLNGCALHSFKANDKRIINLVLADNGHTLISSGLDSVNYFWSTDGLLKTSHSVHQREVNDICISPDGLLLASVSNDGTAHLWNKEGEIIQSFLGHNGAITAVAFHPQGSGICTGGRDNTIRYWDMEGNEVFQLTGHKDLIYDLAFSQDGQYILSGSKDKTAILWDMEGNQIRHFKGHKRSIRSVSFSPDGKYIAAASLDETATIWNLEEDSHFKLNGHKAAIYSIEFSPDGKHIVTGSADGTIKLWDLEGVELQTLSGHQGRVYTAIFSPDGKKIYSAGDDGKIKTWQTWYAFLASNDLYQLSPQEQFNYQLIDTPPITRDESDLTRTVTYNMEGNIQLLSKQNQQGIPPLSQRRWYLGYRYSCKAFLSPDLEEKISLQKKSISLAASHLSNLERIKRENPAFKNRRIGRGIFNSLSYFHANQAIWMLAKGNFEAAKLLSEKSRTYSTSEDAAFIIETKSALIFLFSDQWEEARQIVDKMKSITIDESMANLHKLVTYQDINTETPILQLVLEDIAFLQSHSIDHPDLERFKKLLITTP